MECNLKTAQGGMLLLLLLRNTELHEFVGAPPGGSGSWFHGDRDY